MSDIQVSVQWKSSTVFAGEELECIITFKNSRQAQKTRNSPSPSSQLRGQGSGRERWKETLPQQGANKSIGHTRNSSLSQTDPSQQILKGSGYAAEFNSPTDTRHNSTPNSQQILPSETVEKKDKHKRSISIVSLGNDSKPGAKNQGAAVTAYKHNGSGHARAASLQVSSRRSGMAFTGPTSGEREADERYGRG